MIAALSQRGKDKKLRAVIGGHDGRLSLSRLQAFAWTMILFGSYCAAMIVHPRIIIATADDSARAKSAYDAATAALKTSEDALTAANLTASEKKSAIKPGDAVTKKASDDADAAARKAKDDRDAKKAAVAAAKDAWRKTRWVEIPNPLLALAGISLASGVFASVISASNDNGKDPAVTDLEVRATVTSPPTSPLSGSAAGPDWLEITGTNLGDWGTVRLNGVYVHVIYWRDSSIGVDLPGSITYSDIAVDSKNGKVAYQLCSSAAGPIVCKRIVKSEWSDLFRDDADPSTLSLMKVQMFGWTLVVMAIYCFIFLTNLSSVIDTLPVVDPTLVLLTGLSQTGYISGKGASTIANPGNAPTRPA